MAHMAKGRLLLKVEFKPALTKVSYQFGPQHVDLGFVNRQFITGCMSGEIDVYKTRKTKSPPPNSHSDDIVRRSKAETGRKPFLSMKTRQIHRHFARVYGKMGPLLAKNYVVR